MGWGENVALARAQARVPEHKLLFARNNARKAGRSKKRGTTVQSQGEGTMKKDRALMGRGNANSLLSVISVLGTNEKKEGPRKEATVLSGRTAPPKIETKRIPQKRRVSTDDSSEASGVQAEQEGFTKKSGRGRIPGGGQCHENPSSDLKGKGRASAA